VHPALRPYVASYAGYRDRLDPAAVHHGLPSPEATVILTIESPIDVGWAGRPGTGGLFDELASGLHAGPAIVRTHGYQYGIQLGLTPRGVRALLGVPVAALAHDLVPLSALSGLLAGGALDRIRSARTWDARFDVLEACLLRRLSDRADSLGDPRPEVGEAWRLVVASGGRMRIEEVARRVGWSRRFLAPRFAAEYGLGPKQVARVCRFARSRRIAETGRPLVEVAALAGYADQAHLSREWRDLAGRTPTQWLASPYHVEEPACGARADVQDGDPTVLAR